MDDASRLELAEKLDSELDEFIEQKIAECQVKKADEPEKPEQTLDELIEELKQHPAFMTEIDATKPLHPALEGLQALKYESDSNDDNALSFKEDGNKNFERGKYRWAIDNYTEGIKCRPVDRLLNAVLYTNRAAANYRIGNFRSSMNDCVIARKFKNDHLKAIVRGAMCSVELKQYADALKWCDEVLAVTPTDKKIIELRSKADKLLREQERDKRREMAKHRKTTAEEEKLVNAIQERGITLAGLSTHAPASNSQLLVLQSIESNHPSGAKVTLSDDGSLQWPVMFLYPEYAESDFINAFNENSTFADHLSLMFGAELPPWDVEHKYLPDRLKLYYENKDAEHLYEVKQTSTLLSTLKKKRYVVYGGTPCFILLVTDSPFAKHFLARYQR